MRQKVNERDGEQRPKAELTGECQEEKVCEGNNFIEKLFKLAFRLQCKLSQLSAHD